LLPFLIVHDTVRFESDKADHPKHRGKQLLENLLRNEPVLGLEVLKFVAKLFDKSCNRLIFLWGSNKSTTMAIGKLVSVLFLDFAFFATLR
jgi:hypothetical protein